MKKFIKSLLVFSFVVMSFAQAALNLNTATQAELEALPGVGEKMATAIIAARPFKSLEDLKNVKGVGDSKFAKLKDLVSVDGSAPAAPAEATGLMDKVQSKVESAKTSATTQVQKAAESAKLAAGEVININSASLAELEKLPGIGEKKAAAIIAARPFAKPEDIMKVKGIKEGIFKKIQPFISVQ